jgi:ABC-type sugar transport system substrate-binding protein
MMLLIVVSFAVAQERKEITIANIRWDMGDIAFNGDQYGTETYLKEFEQKTGIKVKMLTFGSNDPIEQRKAAEAYFSRGIDGMLLSAINPPAVVPIVQEANRGIFQLLRTIRWFLAGNRLVCFRLPSPLVKKSEKRSSIRSWH